MTEASLPLRPESAEASNRLLKRSCLSYTEVLAQSVSVIAPSTVPAAVMGLIFARAGNATWLSFLIGIAGLVLVSLNINQFARRSASPASLYSYIVQGISPTAGVLGGWALLFAYTLTGMSTLCGASLVANVLLRHWFGAELPTLALFAIGTFASFFIAFRDIQLSAKMMLAFEVVALLLVLALGGLIWSHRGFAVDQAQLTLEGATATDALAGVVLVIFGFSGFESATVLGDEAKNPLKTIPRSVLQSVLLAGFFFIVMAYITVLGFRGHTEPLAQSEAPLSSLAGAIGWGGLARAIDVGILLSFFSCTLASINSSARILFAMANHRLIADAIGHAHVQNRTPHVAVALCALLTFCIPSALHLSGVSAFAAQGHFGTLCSFGFIIVYILVSIAAPRYLATIGKLNGRAIAYSVGAIAFLALPVLATVGIPGSELFPSPDAMGVLLVGVFAVYMAIGVGWLALRRARQPRMISHMKSAIEHVQLQFAPARESAETK